MQGAPQSLATQQIATEPVTDRQRVTTLAAAAADREVAFEVRAPDRVRCIVLAQTVAVRRAPPDAAARTRQPVALEEVADCAHGGQQAVRPLTLQQDAQLSRTPARMPAAKRQHHLDDVVGQGVGVSVWRSRAVL